MSQTQTVSINGRQYDPRTGLPIDQTPSASPHAATPMARPNAGAVHSHMQRSQTLNRQFTKKPIATPKAQAAATKPHASTPQRQVRQRATVAKSPATTRFAPHPQPANPARQSTARRAMMNDIAPVKHPSVTKVQQVQAQKAALAPQQKRSVVAPVAPQPIKPASKPTHTPAKVLKEEAIENAFKNAQSRKEQEKAHKRSFFSRHPRAFSIASASLALVLLAGYFTYLNMPSLSVRVAAVQAGVNASYPDYQPDGYTLSGPVAVEHGKVKMSFTSNGGPQNFTVTQEKSGWDSVAVADNLVKPKSKDSYVTTNERGLTIYTYDGNAAWVNGGILYTIEGDAPLSSEQIRRIATSL